MRAAALSSVCYLHCPHTASPAQCMNSLGPGCKASLAAEPWLVRGSTRCCVHRPHQCCLFLVFLPHSCICRMSVQPGQMSLWSFWYKWAGDVPVFIAMLWGTSSFAPHFPPALMVRNLLFSFHKSRSDFCMQLVPRTPRNLLPSLLASVQATGPGEFLPTFPSCSPSVSQVPLLGWRPCPEVARAHRALTSPPGGGFTIAKSCLPAGDLHF